MERYFLRLAYKNSEKSIFETSGKKTGVLSMGAFQVLAA